MLYTILLWSDVEALGLAVCLGVCVCVCAFFNFFLYFLKAPRVFIFSLISALPWEEQGEIEKRRFDAD